MARLNAQWVEKAMARTPHQRVRLDMDSSESPVHGEQERAAYNGHFGSVCYHPLFVFNEFADCEGAMLRPGNFHSAHGWRVVLEPIVARYGRAGVRRYLRAEPTHVQGKYKQHNFQEEVATPTLERTHAPTSTPGRKPNHQSHSRQLWMLSRMGA